MIEESFRYSVFNVTLLFSSIRHVEEEKFKKRRRFINDSDFVLEFIHSIR